MAAKGYFFDAHKNPDGSYDREYGAADHADFYNSFFTNGIFANENPSALLATVSGDAIKSIDIAAGRILVNGYQAIFDGTDSFQTATLANGMYRLVIRLDKNEDVRAFSCELVQGTASAYPELIREGNVYDMCIANVTITSGIPMITDTRADRELCGFAAFTGQPAYQPSTDVPANVWDYTLFPESLTAEQRAIVENTPDLFNLYIKNRFNTIYKLNDMAVAPALVWLYTLFPELLTAEQRNTLENTPGWMSMYQSNRFNRQKQLIATFTASGVFKLEDYNLPLGTYIDAFLLGGGGGGGGGNGWAGHGGGGGGHGLLVKDWPVTTETLSIVIGAGGNANTSGGTTILQPRWAAAGGTAGGSANTFTGGSGGSGGVGGGGGGGGAGAISGNLGPGAGGKGGNFTGTYSNSGGGGGSGGGRADSGTYGGNGGAGGSALPTLFNPYDNQWYGGGGGGGSGGRGTSHSQPGGAGSGAGGAGGKGAIAEYTSGAAGASATSYGGGGGGAGGGGSSNPAGGKGSPGVVMIYARL